MRATWLLVSAIVAAVWIAPGIATAQDDSSLYEAKPTKSKAPRYPGKAFRDQVSGAAIIEVTVGEGGTVTGAEVVAEVPKDYGFGAAARAAVLRWEFADTPPGRYQITLHFSM